MTKQTKFTMTVAWILLTRSFDAYSTNQLTHDLSKESNPLVSVLGMTWTPLLITLGFLTLYAVYAYYISVFRPKNLLPTEKGLSFGAFVAYTYLGHQDHWMAILYKLPKDFGRFNQYMGHILTQCLSYAGLVSTIMWLLIQYSELYRSIHSAALVYGVLVSGCVIIIYLWNQKMYRQYLTLTYKN